MQVVCVHILLTVIPEAWLIYIFPPMTECPVPGTTAFQSDALNEIWSVITFHVKKNMDQIDKTDINDIRSACVHEKKNQLHCLAKQDYCDWNILTSGHPCQYQFSFFRQLCFYSWYNHFFIFPNYISCTGWDAQQPLDMKYIIIFLYNEQKFITLFTSSQSVLS